MVQHGLKMGELKGVESGFARGEPTFRFFNTPKQGSTVAYILRCPEFLKDLERTRGLGRRFFQHALPIPNPSLQIGCATQVVCIIDRVRLDLVEVDLRIAELVFMGK
jgi:hypothetical protein